MATEKKQRVYTKTPEDLAAEKTYGNPEARAFLERVKLNKEISKLYEEAQLKKQQNAPLQRIANGVVNAASAIRPNIQGLIQQTVPQATPQAAPAIKVAAPAPTTAIPGYYSLAEGVGGNYSNAIEGGGRTLQAVGGGNPAVNASNTLKAIGQREVEVAPVSPALQNYPRTARDAMEESAERLKG